MSTTIDWGKVSFTDMATIRRIAKRAKPLLETRGEYSDLISISMDLTAAHVSCPLDLVKLEHASDFDFAHDVCGIMRHLDRNTGELLNCFMPRAASAN